MASSLLCHLVNFRSTKMHKLNFLCFCESKHGVWGCKTGALGEQIKTLKMFLQIKYVFFTARFPCPCSTVLWKSELTGQEFALRTLVIVQRHTQTSYALRLDTGKLFCSSQRSMQSVSLPLSPTPSFSHS